MRAVASDQPSRAQRMFVLAATNAHLDAFAVLHRRNDLVIPAHLVGAGPTGLTLACDLCGGSAVRLLLQGRL
jgi:hypothetical protein